MDGTYGNVFPTSRGMSPNVQTPNNNQYKINVNRQKTKKWANFKPQNYDGDDWGADYDDPADDPEPMPPQKPMGPRYPAAHSQRQFQPVGSPPLHTRTQQFPGPASARPGQSEAISVLPSQFRGLPRSATEPAGSPPQRTPGHALSLFPPEVKHDSTGPQTAAPPPSQFPPRKGSIDTSDAEDILQAARQTSSSPSPSNSSKPWIGARPASPLSTGPLASLNKPLPFIRPADVYRRMEEERRTSLETGRPGGDSGMPATQPQGATQAPLAGSAATEELGPAGVAERKSEYGIEGFLASYGGEDPRAVPATAQEQAKGGESQKFVQPVSHEELRRFSTSPQLPDLARMSGFGEDLFSSSFFPASGLRSPLSGSMQLSSPGPSTPASGDPAPVAPAATQSTDVSTPQGAVSGLPLEEPSQHVSSPGVDGNTVMPAPEEPDRDPPAGGLHHGSSSAAQPVFNASEQQAPAAEVAREPALHEAEQPATRATRPSLPGGWVSETPSASYEVVVPTPAPVTPETSVNTASVENAPQKLDPDGQSEVPALNVPKPSTPTESETTGAVRDGSTSTNKTHSSVPSRPRSPQGLPPLRTPSPALSTELDMRSARALSETQDRNSPSPAKVDAAGVPSPLPASAATEHSEITPTAPLNPRRATPELGTISQPVLSPPSLASGSSLEASTDSPVKDYDALSEEIIKSLSPVKPAGSPAEPAEGTTTAYHAAADPARESSYLGDVYGDYWAATEDKADPGMLASSKASQPEKTVQDPLPSPAIETPKANPTVAATTAPGSSGPSTPLSSQSANVPHSDLEVATGSAEGRRRFSWEAALEGPAPPSLSTAPFVEQKLLGSGAENVAAMEAKTATQETKSAQLPTDPEGAKSAEELRAESAPEVDPEIHHAPQTSMLAPTSTSERARDSPSPLSVLTDKTKRLSLAEEKILLNETTTPVSPSPPLEQHPMFAGTQQPRLAELPSTPNAQNIMSFRSIMEMPSPAERVKHFSETRFQFATVDTGLEDWLKAMLARHPEHAEAGFTFSVAVPTTLQSGHGAPPTTSGIGQGLRAPTHLHMPHHLQQLGHSSGQMGTKSKELLMAAGKAGKGFGKGLLSKGRNKLRGKGE
ncbi:hypothetical protein VTI74DRAFT_5582 [Chaetomium olivicolor]